eukprot:TRINITY_DN2081_c0_g1_i3.p1 TRINITY_DN2081_c0_g1~~TRINITY_DN2081_c0_g1_i3.p1  ORF type:complete len:176 (+),score=33.51 TRINITY_DN2081_c0_g1_i3:598-1125(+)
MIRMLQDERIESKVDFKHLFNICIYRRLGQVLKEVLKNNKFDITKGGDGLVRAATYGHLEIVETLMEDGRFDPNIHDNEALLQACQHGHKKVVEVLLDDERVDPTTDNYSAIRIAMRKGHIDIARIILQHERVDPKEFDEEIIKMFEQYNLKLNGRELVKQGMRSRSTRVKYFDK